MKEEKYIRKSFGKLHVYLAANSFYKICSINFNNHGYENDRTFTLAIPYLFYFSIGYPAKKYPTWDGKREISLSFHSNSLWWQFWSDPDCWSSKDSKWRRGAFHLDDFFLGKSKFSEEFLEERNVLIPMPEKSYEATAKLTLDTWTRPRWFKKQIKRIHIEIPEGIPFEGKGENSWDCGKDATFGITCPAESIPEGVGTLVGSVLRSRVKNGGWSDWTWTKD